MSTTRDAAYRERVCSNCNKMFRGDTLRCRQCRYKELICIECGKLFRGDTKRCKSCTRIKHICAKCGKSHKGSTIQCWACKAKERICIECDRTFIDTQSRCSGCRYRAVPEIIRRTRGISYANVRRARKLNAEIDGPVSQAIYLAIRVEGPCVYCGNTANTVDHVRPLARGGWEHESNLVPACAPCNHSKNDRLLTEWQPDRVEYGALHSVKVAAELARLMEVVT